MIFINNININNNYNNNNNNNNITNNKKKQKNTPSNPLDFEISNFFTYPDHNSL